MNLSNDDAKKFWPIYDEYEHERGKLATMRIDILTEFAKNYKTLTDEHADKLITGVFEYQKEMTSLRQSYYKKVKKALNARRAASFVQVEEFLESAIRLLIQANVPYIAN
jgi:vacuolar-type H+-ATPase subunit D/Vma8